MLLFTTPSHPRVPEWFQLLGLGLLLTMIGATVHTWRRTIADELTPAGRTVPAAGEPASVCVNSSVRSAGCASC